MDGGQDQGCKSHLTSLIAEHLSKMLEVEVQGCRKFQWSYLSFLIKDNTSLIRSTIKLIQMSSVCIGVDEISLEIL